MNNLFQNKFTNHVATKLNTLKDIFKLPHTLYSNAKYNKKNNNKNDKKKNKYIPKKINKNTNHFKYKTKNNSINTILLKEITKDIEKKTHNYKEPIPKRIRELVWTTNNGETFSHKCYVTWCYNTMNVFNFQVGHDIPESKGGTIDIDNLKPICASCNLSMSNKYTIAEWSKLIDMNSIKHIEEKKNKKNIKSCDNNNDNDKSTLITKIKNSFPKLPSISLVGIVLTTFRYLKI
jgi:hypothetical protein